jgi:hypothetical protein
MPVGTTLYLEPPLLFSSCPFNVFVISRESRGGTRLHPTPSLILLSWTYIIIQRSTRLFSQVSQGYKVFFPPFEANKARMYYLSETSFCNRHPHPLSFVTRFNVATGSSGIIYLSIMFRGALKAANPLI